MKRLLAVLAVGVLIMTVSASRAAPIANGPLTGVMKQTHIHSPLLLSQGGTVCCVEGKRVWRTGADRCRREGGAPTNMSYCRRACCKKGGRYGWQIYTGCRRTGGQVVADAQCNAYLGGAPVCCVKGSAVWKTRPGICRSKGGSPTNMSYCRKVCCKLRNRYSWQMHVACKRWNGRIVAAGQCHAYRSGPDVCCVKGTGVFRTKPNICRDEGGTPTNMSYCRKVCCKRGTRYSWQMYVACKRWSGRIVPDSQCR